MGIFTNFLKNNAGNLLNAGAQLYGGYQANKAADKAAKQQMAAAQQAMAYQQQRESPYLNIGKKAANMLSSRMHEGRGGVLRNYRPEDMYQDPGYQFMLNEGIDARNKAAAAGGRRMSGGQIKDLQDYTMGMASTYYDKSRDRFNQDQRKTYNTLSGLMNPSLGQSGTIGNYMTGMGDARSAATISGSNAWNNALSGAMRPFTTQRLVDKYGRPTVIT
jgi:hypothetical protein